MENQFLDKRCPMVEYKGKRYRKLRAEFRNEVLRYFLEFLDGSNRFWVNPEKVTDLGKEAPTADWVVRQSDPDKKLSRCSECKAWGKDQMVCTKCKVGKHG